MEIRRLKAKSRQLREVDGILRRHRILFAGEFAPRNR